MGINDVEYQITHNTCTGLYEVRHMPTQLAMGSYSTLQQARHAVSRAKSDNMYTCSFADGKPIL